MSDGLDLFPLPQGEGDAAIYQMGSIGSLSHWERVRVRESYFCVAVETGRIISGSIF
jgi:hypothetical protein